MVDVLLMPLFEVLVRITVDRSGPEAVEAEGRFLRQMSWSRIIFERGFGPLNEAQDEDRDEAQHDQFTGGQTEIEDLSERLAGST